MEDRDYFQEDRARRAQLGKKPPPGPLWHPGLLDKVRRRSDPVDWAPWITAALIVFCLIGALALALRR